MQEITSRIEKLANKLNSKGNSPLFNRLRHALQWSFIGLFLSKGAAFLASVIVARILGPTGNGELGVIATTLGLFSTVAGMGLGLTSTKFIAEYKSTDKLKVGRVVGMTNIVGASSAFVFGILLFLGSEWLCSVLLNAPQLSVYLKIASITAIFSTYNGIQKGVLSGYEQFKKIALIDTISGTIIFLLSILGVVYWGLMGVVLGQAMGAFITNFLYYYFIRKSNKENGIKPEYKTAFTEKRILLTFSIPLMLGGILVTPTMWFCQTIITNTENGYVELGIYNAAVQWRQILHLIPSVLGNALLPILVSDREKSVKLEKINILLGWMLVSICSLPILLFPEYIAKIYGSEYDVSKYAVSAVLIVFTCIIYSYKEGITRKLVQKSVLWLSLSSNLLWAVVAIALHYCLRQYGSIGVAVAYLVAYMLSTIVFLPIYTIKGYVKREVIISKRIAYIWVAISIQFVVSIIKINIYLRVFVAVMICWFILIKLKKIIKSE